MPDIFVEGNYYQGTSDACIIDLTPPVFGGVNFLDVESRGQIRAGWSIATDANNPIRYEVYIQASTATGLFNFSNITAITPNLLFDIFSMPDGSFLQNGVTYFVGVRAVDAIGNRESNTVSLSVISTGILTSIDTYQVDASYTNITDAEFKVVAWANKNMSLAIPSAQVMGAASYQVYDAAGLPVSGFTGAVGSPNAQGLYVFPAVSNTLSTSESYQIRVTASVDGENRSNVVAINKQEEIFVIDGVASLDGMNNVTGGFWIENNSNIITTGLSTADYSVYTAGGILVPSLGETGIVADANGFYKVTPFALPNILDVTQAYVIKVELTVDGQQKIKNIIIDDQPVVYDIKSVFSINALNQLEATFWTTKNDNLSDPAILGTASYQIYDKNGVAVVGLTQSGITADLNGYFHTTPISAALLSDLTHYTAKVTISVAGVDRVSTKGFTLLGT